jgi:hypothetical protein
MSESPSATTAPRCNPRPFGTEILCRLAVILTARKFQRRRRKDLKETSFLNGNGHRAPARAAQPEILPLAGMPAPVESFNRLLRRKTGFSTVRSIHAAQQ